VRRLQHRAAQRTDDLGRLLRLVYFREWRFTRRAAAEVSAGAAATIRSAQAARQRLVTRKDAARDPDAVLDAEQTPRLPAPEKPIDPKSDA
jgi:hypothetical protein